ncbi:MAG: nitrate ABC transporter permease, partial [Burkholderia sp.]|nr:nitrate ABC transporter permease [Burkholderia sp.]
DRTILREQIDETNALITDNAAGHRLGWLRPERIDATLGFVSRAFALGAKVKAGSLYTNRFVQ